MQDHHRRHPATVAALFAFDTDGEVALPDAETHDARMAKKLLHAVSVLGPRDRGVAGSIHKYTNTLGQLTDPTEGIKQPEGEKS